MATSGTYYSAIPATTLTYSNGFTQSSNGIIKFTGTGTWIFRVNYIIVCSNSSNNRSLGIALYKNGAVVTGSNVYSPQVTSALYTSMQGTMLVSMTTNDTLGIYCTDQNFNTDTLSIIKFMLLLEPVI